jgi:hypothetical protein
MGPEPEFYSVALCAAIGDNLTAIVACYLKAAVTNPTSDPLPITLGGDQLTLAVNLVAYRPWPLYALR